MSENLDNKVALVTGAARRIGAAIARGLHGDGARVAIHYRGSAADAEALANELNELRADSAAAFQLDLQCTDDLPGLVADVAGYDRGPR